MYVDMWATDSSLKLLRDALCCQATKYYPLGIKNRLRAISKRIVYQQSPTYPLNRWAANTHAYMYYTYVASAYLLALDSRILTYMPALLQVVTTFHLFLIPQIIATNSPAWKRLQIRQLNRRTSPGRAYEFIMFIAASKSCGEEKCHSKWWARFSGWVA